jgi:hypothetical protein
VVRLRRSLIRGKQNLSGEAFAWLLKKAKALSKDEMCQIAAQAGAKARNRFKAQRREERAAGMAAGQTQSTDPRYKALLNSLDEDIDREAARTPNSQSQQREDPKIREVLKDQMKFWFNRLDAIFLVPRLLIIIFTQIGAWSVSADWFYKLLVSCMVFSLVAITLDLVLSPLALLYWVIDSRYPLKNRFLYGFKGILCSAVFVTIEFGIYYFLLTHHVGNTGGLI